MHGPPGAVQSLCRRSAPSRVDQRLSNLEEKLAQALDFSSADARHSNGCAITVSRERGPLPVRQVVRGNQGPLGARASRLSFSASVRETESVRRRQPVIYSLRRRQGASWPCRPIGIVRVWAASGRTADCRVVAAYAPGLRDLRDSDSQKSRRAGVVHVLTECQLCTAGCPRARVRAGSSSRWN